MAGKLATQIEAIEKAEQLLHYKKLRTLEKALKSDHPDDMIKAANSLASIQPKQPDDSKSFFVDPLEFQSSLGFKDKPFSLSYTTLRRMSKAPIINAIIKTRKNQIADFAEPQSDKYSTGFVIRKKPKFGVNSKMDDKDKRIANAITDFILNCGEVNSWEHDDFDTFIRKSVDDSLVYDQMTFECIRNRRGKLTQFMATDASSFRMAESYFDNNSTNVFFKRNTAFTNQDRMLGQMVKGYKPSYVQIYQNAVVSECLPWEMCFGVRNPSSSIYANGYGTSELEELINVVTSMLWGDEYNRRFFSQGSAPKGLLRVKGNVNEASLQQFKQQWQSMITGVMQSWKTPVVEGDIDWIDLQKNNRDMEYTAWIEYLIKLACAIYSIDPTEIGWDISKSGGGGMFEGSQAERLKNSKDKGLYPLLKFLQRKINKYIVEQINPEFEFQFVGLNGMTISEEVDLDVKKLGSFMKINEIREKWELEPIGEEGEIIENAVYISAKTQAAQATQQANMNGDGEDTYNPFEEAVSDEDTSDSEYDNDEDSEKAEDNSFIKAFDNFLKQEEDGSTKN